MIISMTPEIIYLAISIIVTIFATTLATIYTVKSTAKETQKILREIGCVMAKIRTDSKASAWRDGYIIAENISEEECKKLGEPYFYDPATKVCHYKPKKSAV